VLAGAGISVAGWVRALGLDGASTGPRQLAWFGEHGEPLAEPPRCGGLGSFLLRDREWLWTSCDRAGEASGGDGGDGFARLDLASGTARLSWPVPRELSAGRVRGVLPGPRDRLALVWDLGNHHLVAGVIGPDGWSVRAPRALEPGDLLGMAWTDEGDALEVAVVPRTRLHRTTSVRAPNVRRIHIHRLDRREVQVRSIATARLCVALGGMCTAAGAVHSRGRWRFLVVSDPEASVPGKTFEVAEGDRRLRRVSERRVEREDLDLTMAGVLTDGATQRYVPGAGLSRLAEPTAAHGWLEIDGGRVYSARRHPLAFGIGAVHVLGARQIEVRRDETRLVVRDRGAPAGEERTVARAGAGQLAESGTMVPRSAGVWLVDGAGSYVTLDAELRREDPLSLREHLGRGGSRLARADERGHERRLAWVLFGLPISVAAGGVLEFVARPARVRPLAFLVAFAVAYLVSAVVCLAMVWPVVA
jgi:hypothetical protein